MVSKAPPSWKQKKPTPPPGAVGLKQRRFISTLALLTAVVLAALFAYRLVNQRLQETWIVHIGKAAKDNKFALPPIRFVDQAWLGLKSNVDKANYLHFEPVESLAAEAISTSIAKIRTQKGQQAENALIVWIDGIGISHQGTPFIVGSQFQLPNDPEHFETDPNLIKLESVLTEISQWPGPKLLILDWGQEVFDPRISLLGNDFVSALAKTVTNFRTKEDSANAACWVLISHMQAQVSLVDEQDRQSIFGRAVGEALSNRRQMPSVDPTDRSKSPKSNHLNLANLAEYVYRRVSADSQNFQTPWLLRTGLGLVSPEGLDVAADVKLMALDSKTGNPLGITSGQNSNAVPQKDETASDKNTADKGKQPSTSVVDATTAKILQDLWTELDRWRRVSSEENMEGWSEAALAPLAYKSLAAQVLDIDLHAYAGLDVSADAKELLRLITSLKRQRPVPSFALPADVRASDKLEYEQEYITLRNQRQLACLQIDALQLIGSLRVFTKTLDLSAHLNRIARSFEVQDPEAQTILASEIQTCIETLAKHENKGTVSALAEIFLQSSALTTAQRSALRELQSQLHLPPGDRNEVWETRPLRIPENISVRQSWPMDLRSDIGTELVSRLINSTGETELDINSIAWADPRDVQVVLAKGNLSDSIELGREFPSFPVRPEPPSQWLIQWGNDGAPLASNGDSIQLEINKELPLSVRVQKTGTQPLEFPKLTLTPEHIGIVVNGRQYDLGEPVELDETWFDQQSSVRQLAIKVYRSERVDPVNNATLRLDTKDTSVKKRPEPLTFDLPTNNPIELKYGQRLLKNGKAAIQMVKANSRVVLTPFPGRESQFQFEIKNVDSRAHAVELRLFSMPVDENDLEAEVGTVSGRPNVRGRIPDGAWKVDAIAGGQVEKVKLAPPSTPGAAPPAGAPTDKSQPQVSDQNINIAGGAVIQVIVDDKPPKEFIVHFVPKSASEYIDATVNYDDKGTLSINAAWTDSDDDGLADGAPLDLSPEKPVSLKWDSLPWQPANAKVPSGTITLKTPKVEVQSIRNTDLKMDRESQEVWINVDDTPRSLVFGVDRNARGEVSRQVDRQTFRCLWRQYALVEDGKPVFTYVPYRPGNSKTVKQIIGSGKAVFGELKGAVQIQLAVDLLAGERCKILRQGIPIADNQRDRNVVSELRFKGDDLVVKWSESDLQLSLDFSNDIIGQDSDFRLDFSRIGVQADNPVARPQLPTIVADIDAPKLSSTAPYLSNWMADMGTDRPITLTLQVKDKSDSVQAMVMAQKRGTPIQLPLSGAEKLIPDKTSKIALDVSKLEVGEYNILIKMEDAFKHEFTQQLQKPLRINKPVVPVEPKAEKAPAIRGDLKVQAGFANKTRVVRNDVKFQVEPAPEKESRLDKGEMVYQQVELGAYRVSINYEEGNKKYKGTKTIEVKKKEDFAKTHFVELTLVE